MTRVSINPGRVEWCGESHRIGLHDQDHLPPVSLAMFFRVCLSPHGRGSGCMLLGAPGRGAGWPDAPNLLMTDNQRLLRWIVDVWTRHDPEFGDMPALDAMSWLDLESATSRCRQADGRCGEILRGQGVTINLAWEKIGPPIPLELDQASSMTGRHELYAVCCEASIASIMINGTRLAGQPSSRPQFGQQLSTAWRRYSETWVRAGGG